jgi:hypothetical protein
MAAASESQRHCRYDTAPIRSAAGRFGLAEVKFTFNIKEINPCQAMDHIIPHMPCQGFLNSQNTQSPRISRLRREIPYLGDKNRYGTKCRGAFPCEGMKRASSDWNQHQIPNDKSLKFKYQFQMERFFSGACTWKSA